MIIIIIIIFTIFIALQCVSFAAAIQLTKLGSRASESHSANGDSIDVTFAAALHSIVTCLHCSHRIAVCGLLVMFECSLRAADAMWVS